MGEVLSSINSTLWLVAESSDSSKDLDSNNITVIIGTHEEDEVRMTGFATCLR